MKTASRWAPVAPQVGPPRATLLALAWLLVAARPAAAHLTPNSEIDLDIGRNLVTADLIIPMGELGYAFGQPLSVRPADRASTLAGLSDYLRRRISVSSPDGRPWQIAFTQIDITRDRKPDLTAHLELQPPSGASARRFDLHDGAVVEEVPSHFALVLQRTDFDAGRLSDHPRILGNIRRGAETLRIDLGPGNAWRGFLSAIGLGMRHIAEGHDHLLFLTALLLPAPLLAAAGRWTGYGGLKFTARRLTGVVTAFTVGHSLTLIGGAFFGWRLPAQPVEVLIAVSILISSIHAWRPLFAGREPWVAGGFGLVHGLAFATLIGHFGLEPLQKAQSILGFNIGIELIQLAVVTAVTPALVLLAQTRFYPPLRVGAAIFAGVAALSWILERTMGVENVVGRAIDEGLGHAPWLLLALTTGAVVAYLAERRGRLTA